MDDLPTHILTQSDLLATWSRLIELGGPTRPSIWMMLIRADGTPVQHLTEIDDVADAPDPALVDGLTTVLTSLGDDLPDARVAFLRARPARGPVDAIDRAWATGLMTAARRASVACEVVHLAAGDRVVPLPWDELGATLSA